jgi:hypothetical protein
MPCDIQYSPIVYHHKLNLKQRNFNVKSMGKCNYYTAKLKNMACKYTVEKENNTFSAHNSYSQHYTAKICTTCIQYLKLFSESSAPIFSTPLLSNTKYLKRINYARKLLSPEHTTSGVVRDGHVML